ncbi:hypothetical protein QJS66_07730 [Kocuria rhizophila]|nr:hypothetical protein QJS66_07730 [Kocuria rhizophila]
MLRRHRGAAEPPGHRAAPGPRQGRGRGPVAGLGRRARAGVRLRVRAGRAELRASRTPPRWRWSGSPGMSGRTGPAHGHRLVDAARSRPRGGCHRLGGRPVRPRAPRRSATTWPRGTPAGGRVIHPGRCGWCSWKRVIGDPTP